MSVTFRRAMLGSALFVCAVTVTACGGSDDAPPPPEEAAATMADAMQQMQQASEQMSEARSNVALIPATALLEALPSSIDGMARSNAERSESGAMGFKISTASATYRADNRSIELELTDVGGTGMMAAMGAAWAMVDLDKANETGYEKTVTIDGNRGYEKEERSGDRKDTELSVIVSQRVLVKLDGTNVSMDVLHDAFKSLKVKALVRAP